MQTEHAHTVSIDLPASEAIHLFTPRGEESWVPGWEPRYITPADGETCEEMLFVTAHGDETTYWTCMRWNPEAGHARYLRLTPDSRVGFVDVRCSPDGPDRTTVHVSYRMHALSSAGRARLEATTDAAFSEMIEDWSRLIAVMPR